MNRVNYLKRDHEEIFRHLLEFEEIIDTKELDNEELARVLHKMIDLVQKHMQNEEFLLNEINNDYYMKIPIAKITMDPRRINGHIKVISDAILSKDLNFIKVALDNDGRMMLSKIKDHIFMEEKILDRLLFLHIANV